MSWMIVGIFCLLLLALWLFVKRKQNQPQNDATLHRRFPVGQSCYLITIETQGKRYTVYESPQGLVQLEAISLKNNERMEN